MATYDYVPQTLDAQDLTASPFTRCWFMVPNSPVDMPREYAAVEADVLGLGLEDVRAQPRGQVWDMQILLEDDAVATENSMKKVFSPERGLVYLKANDGDGNAWRVSVRVLGLKRVRGQTRWWVASLRVPRPVWEENSSTSEADLAASGDSAAQSPTNAGNRKAFPTYAIEPTAQKAKDPEQDFMHATRGFVVNRAPGFWNDLPVDLSDANNGHGGWDTASLINDTSESGTSSANYSDSATTVVLNGGHGFSDGPQFFYNSDTDEQFYGKLSTNTISSIVRGIGGTSAAAITSGDTINASQMLADCSDVRVYVNQKEVERWIENANSAATRVWVNLTMPLAVKLTATNAGTAGSPANNGEIAFDEGVEGLPETGVLWNAGDSTPNRELIAYMARDIPGKAVTTIERDVWYEDGAAAAWAAGEPFYLVDKLFVIAWGRTVGSSFSNPIGPAPEPSDRRPAIQLKSSDNNTWRYGDQSDDASTVFYDKDTPNRTAMFRPNYHVDPDDNNNARPLQLVDSSDIAQWKNTAREAGKLDVGRLTLDLPQGIAAEASAITYDVTRRPSARMRILGRDAEGFEQELADEWTEDDGEAAQTGETIQPNAVLRQLTLNGVRAITLGNAEFDAAQDHYLDLPSETEYPLEQEFILDNELDLTYIMLRLNNTGASSPGEQITVAIHEDDGGGPAASPYIKFANWTANSDVEEFDLDAVPTTDGYLVGFFNADDSGDPLPFKLPAGTYWIVIDAVGTFTHQMRFWFGPRRSKHARLNYQITVNPGADFNIADVLWFAIIHDGPGPVQPESVKFDGGDTPSFDKLILELNDASDPADDETPHVDRSSAREDTVYHCIGVWTNSTTGDSLTIDAWLDVFSSASIGALQIDCEAKTVEYREGFPSPWVWDIPVVLTPSNIKEWMPLDPGANSLSYAEQDMTATDLVLVWRGRRS